MARQPRRDRNAGGSDPSGPPHQLPAALAGILALKLVVLWQLADYPLLQPGGGLDADYYFHLAQRVAGGDLLLAPGLYFVSPLYIYFLAAGLAVSGGSLFVVKVLQIALGAAACGLVWLTAREWFGERAAWIAMAFAALTGVFTFYEVLILQAALDPFLTALDLWLLTLALTRGGARWPLAAGAALALHSLNRPNLLLVGAGLGLMLFSRPGTRRTALAAALGAVLVFLPVSLRNAVAAGTFMPIPSHGGLNLYIGNNPAADGTYRSVEGITPNIAGQAADAKRVAEQAEGRPLTDAEVSSHFTRRTLQWIRDRPADAARLLARKVAFTLNHAFLTLNYSYPFYRDESFALRLLAVGPLILVPLGLVGLFTYWIRGEKPRAGYAVFAAVVPLLIVSIAIFFVAARYRVPLLVPLCVASGALLDALARAARARRTAAVPMAAACVLAVGVIAGQDLKLDDARGEEETRMAVWLASNGRAREAEARLSRIRRDDPSLGVAHARVGQALAAAGRPDEALEHYEAAVKIDPSEPAPRTALARLSGERGVALARQGRDADALRHLARAALLASGDAPAQLNLAVQLARMERYAEARAAADRALKIDPDYARAREFLAALDHARK